MFAGLTSKWVDIYQSNFFCCFPIKTTLHKGLAKMRLFPYLKKWITDFFCWEISNAAQRIVAVDIK